MRVDRVPEKVEQSDFRKVAELQKNKDLKGTAMSPTQSLTCPGFGSAEVAEMKVAAEQGRYRGIHTYQPATDPPLVSRFSTLSKPKNLDLVEKLKQDPKDNSLKPDQLDDEDEEGMKGDFYTMLNRVDSPRTIEMRREALKHNIFGVKEVTKKKNPNQNTPVPLPSNLPPSQLPKPTLPLVTPKRIEPKPIPETKPPGSRNWAQKPPKS